MNKTDGQLQNRCRRTGNIRPCVVSNVSDGRTIARVGWTYVAITSQVLSLAHILMTLSVLWSDKVPLAYPAKKKQPNIAMRVLVVFNYPGNNISRLEKRGSQRQT